LNTWAKSVAAVTSSSGGKATTRRVTSTSSSAAAAKKIGRLDIDAMRGLEGWIPDRNLIQGIEALKHEGRL